MPDSKPSGGATEPRSRRINPLPYIFAITLLVVLVAGFGILLTFKLPP